MPTFAPAPAAGDDATSKRTGRRIVPRISPMLLPSNATRKHQAPTATRTSSRPIRRTEDDTLTPQNGMENSKAPVVVRPGEGLRFGNVEFLALSEDTSRFNLAIVTIAPGRSGPEAHSHQREDDAFFLLDGELTFTVEDETLAAG